MPLDKDEYTVLIVDDNKDLLQMFSFGLPDMGNFTIITAEDGIEGLEKYYELEPDCMVIDVVMPGLDGYQLVRALRGDPSSTHTPLILLTAMTQDRDKLAGLVSGVDIYLTKPVMPSELVTAILKAIRLGREERQRIFAQTARELSADDLS